MELVLNHKYVCYVSWVNENLVSFSNHHELKATPIKLQANTIKAETEHIYLKDGIAQFIPYGKVYTYEPNVAITNLCAYPKLNIFIDAEELNKYKRIAEIGVRYGSSSKWILDNNVNLEYLDLYEYNDNYISIIRNRLSQYSNYNLVQGNAEETLKENNHYYDLVFFDCSHIYDTDIKILEQLSTHIDSNTTIVFDDYYLYSVKKLVKEAQQKFDCKIIYKIKEQRSLE